jgi:hypothetical protein
VVNANWDYLAPEHGQHIFFYSEKTVAFLAKAHQMAATFIQGYIIFIRAELLENLFIKGTNTLRVDFLSKVNQSVKNLLNKILTNGYKHPVNDNLMLIKSLQTAKKLIP